MSDQSSQEPTMEEILASIRRIISEDEAPADGAAAAPAAEAPPSAAAAAEPALAEIEEPEPAHAADDDELELTDKVETHGDLEVYAPPPEAAAEPAPPLPEGGLVSAGAAAAAAAAFGRLTSATVMPAQGRTLEDLVRELLRPMLQDWLDQSLPGIVQRAVDAEVQRIARGG